MLDMQEIRGKLTRKLSSGQMSRLTLAKAVMTQPRVLLLDEPTASLDPDITQKIKAFLKEHRRSEILVFCIPPITCAKWKKCQIEIIFSAARENCGRRDGPANCGSFWSAGLGRSLFEIGTGRAKNVNVGRIGALLSRHLYLYKRSFARLLEIFYWPFLDLIVWGFITMYLAQQGNQLHGAVTFFLGALILWDVLFRAQQGIALSFLEEMWARNLMNLFASPLTVGEYLMATMTMSIF